MRYHKPNEKAISKTVAFLEDIQNEIRKGHKIIWSDFYSQYKLAKNTGSTLIQLGILSENKESPKTYQWHLNFTINRQLALKILDHNLHRSIKRVDVPLLPEWATEITSVKDLLSEIRDKLAEKNNRSNWLKIAHIADQSKKDRLETARMFASCMVSNREPGSIGPESIDLINQTAISLTDDLLSKLNS